MLIRAPGPDPGIFSGITVDNCKLDDKYMNDLAIELSLGTRSFPILWHLLLILIQIDVEQQVVLKSSKYR